MGRGQSEAQWPHLPSQRHGGFPFQVHPRQTLRTSGFPLQSLARYAVLHACIFEMHPTNGKF
jgi:hypothetical protein